MYSFQPLVDSTANSHGMFYFWCMLMVVLVSVVIWLWNDGEFSGTPVLFWIAFAAFTTMIGYDVSFAPEKVYVNEKVTGTLVGFQPEGYSEKSGKSRSDRHYMYVVYEVNGNHVILKATEGVTYPKTATLYKN